MTDTLPRAPKGGPTKAIPVEKRKLIHVEWTDAHHKPGAWTYTDDIDFDHKVLVWTVGWIVAETETHLHLAPNMGFAPSSAPDDEQLGAVVSIPKGMIHRTRRLQTLDLPKL